MLKNKPTAECPPPVAPPSHLLNTYLGPTFDVLAPTPEQVNILSIAHGLAGTMRFGGQSDRWYTVAQHSLEVSLRVERILNRSTLADRLHLERLQKLGLPWGRQTFSAAAKREAALWGLLHDSAEAWLPDVQRPIKGLLYFQESGVRSQESGDGRSGATDSCLLSPVSFVSFRAIEARILTAVAERFGLSLPWSPVVEAADNEELRRERRDLWGTRQPAWQDVEPHGPDDSPRLDTLSQRAAETLFLDRFRELGAKE